MIKFKNKLLIVTLITTLYSLICEVSFKSIAETSPQEINKMQLLELWRYSQFIQEVEKGNVEKSLLPVTAFCLNPVFWSVGTHPRYL